MGEAAVQPTLTAGALVVELTESLAAAGIENARAEARDLLAAVLDEPRFWPTANRDAVVSDEVADTARGAARKRAAGAPFAYAVGRAAFRHLTLLVDERVLIPRQETELLVDAVLGAGLAPGGLAVDVGTGSGAIALALASEGRFARVVATDISAGALRVAAENARRLAPSLRCPVQTRVGAFLAPLAAEPDGSARAVVSNPPYIAHAEAAALPAAVRDWEPPLALFSAEEGMAATARIVAEAARLLEPRGLLALEVDSRRAGRAAALVRADGRYADVEVRRDLAGRDRILLARRRHAAAG